jgi:hypothetical protein
MTTFTSEDREKVEKEPIPFYGYCNLTDQFLEEQNSAMNPVIKKINLEYRIDDGSEDLES